MNGAPKNGDRWTNHFFSVDVLSGQGKYLRIRPINALPREEDKGHRPRASIHWAVHTVPPNWGSILYRTRHDDQHNGGRTSERKEGGSTRVGRSISLTTKRSGQVAEQ